jgi:arsenite methyltransferase
MIDTTGVDPDVWSDWLLHRRHGDDPAFAKVVRADVDRFVERVLDAAQLGPGMRLADIGTGEGVIALRATERIGSTLTVILTDVSRAMLQHAESCAVEARVRSQCTFLQCPADHLDDIETASVDVVTTRAVLAYVSDKLAALAEFYRILKPGGRISIAEPILQDDAFLATALKMRLDIEGPRSRDRFLPLLHRWKAAQYPDSQQQISNNPLVNYSERTLFEFVRQAGFVGIHLELHIDLLPSIFPSWDVFLNSSPHPWAPAPRTILAEQFTATERELFEAVMRPTIEAPDAVTISRNVYLNATKSAR